MLLFSTLCSFDILQFHLVHKNKMTENSKAVEDVDDIKDVQDVIENVKTEPIVVVPEGYIPTEVLDVLRKDKITTIASPSTVLSSTEEMYINHRQNTLGELVEADEF